MSPIKRARRLRAWLGDEKRRGSITLAICILVAAGTAWGLNVRQNHQQAKVVAAIRQQGRDGLEIIYTTQLTSCRRGRIKALHQRTADEAQLKFASVLGGILETSVKRAKISARDTHVSEATRQASTAAIATFQRLIDSIPRPTVTPIPKLCRDVVLDPNQLAQQVRNHPGKSNTTTAPSKTTSN